MITSGVIGYGYWGPNIVRNFINNPNIKVKKVSDRSPSRLTVLHNTFPEIEGVLDADDVILDPEIDLVAIITPVFTHYTFAKKALEAGKHIFVEKPFTSTSAEAEELIELAAKKNLMIMVDHTFLFTGAVKKMKELIDDNTLGSLYYYDSVRVNLGLVQGDINVIWDLAPHDISIMNYIVKDIKPYSVNAVGLKHFGKNNEDVAYLSVKFENNFMGHFHVNWLSPVKLRKTLVAGDKKMLVWDDLENEDKIKIYDKGVEIQKKDDHYQVFKEGKEVTDKSSIYELLVKYRSGDMHGPKVENIEALKLETSYMIECLESGKTPINDGREGLKVVRILEASDESLKHNGKEILIG
jgi:predicted dehydrogenase